MQWSAIDDYAAPTDAFLINSVRQLVTVFTSENLLPTNFGYNLPDPGTYELSRTFPNINYIMRPRYYDVLVAANNFVAAGGQIFDQYAVDYPDEHLIWNYGGFRYKPNLPIDYAHKQNIKIYDSKPSVGYEEKGRYFDRVVWSLDRQGNIQDSPNLKTFLVENKYDIDDQAGKIKFAFDADVDRYGNVIYAITERGICMLLVDKNMITAATG